MNAKRVNAASGVICASQKTKQTAAGIAADLEAAGLLQSPESAAELVALRARVAELEPLEDELTGARLCLFEEEQENRRLRTSLLDAAPELSWARSLDAGDLHSLMSELSAALLGYWHDDPDVQVLARAMTVLHEHRGQAAEAAAEAAAPNPGALAEQAHLVDPLDHVLEHLADNVTPSPMAALVARQNGAAS